MPSSMSSKTREHREFQDMYRRNLTAHWTAQPGEPRADECIENIFAGGDGWGHPSGSHYLGVNSRHGDGDRNQSSKHAHARSRSGGIFKGPGTTPPDAAFRPKRREPSASTGVSGRASLEQQANNMKADTAVTNNQAAYEIDEFAIREDLRSWKLPSVVNPGRAPS